MAITSAFLLVRSAFGLAAAFLARRRLLRLAWLSSPLCARPWASPYLHSYNLMNAAPSGFGSMCAFPLRGRFRLCLPIRNQPLPLPPWTGDVPSLGILRGNSHVSDCDHRGHGEHSLRPYSLTGHGRRMARFRGALANAGLQRGGEPERLYRDRLPGHAG